MAKYDFSGWATKNDIRCSDGRTIRKDAFKHNDGQTVPLVWNHRHNDSFDVLGHALLENRDEGVYAYCKFNDTDSGKNAKLLVKHGDVNQLSIYANQLQHQGANVMHGTIREVSLVLAGANPGAFIDSVMIHGEESEEEAVIYTGEDICLYHNNEKEENEMSENKSPREIYDEMTDAQKELVQGLIEAAINDADDNYDYEDDYDYDDDDDDDDYNNDDYDDDEGDGTMKHNVFDKDCETSNEYLSHADEKNIITMAKGSNIGSLKMAMDIYAANNEALAHGFETEALEALLPDYKNLTPGAPDILRADQSWVMSVINKIHKSPYSRIRTRHADARIAELKAKGYQTKGDQKQLTDNIKLIGRSFDPQTIYVKDEMHRDDIIDITDFDTVAYVWDLMKTSMYETLALAALIGDGREDTDPDKIKEDHVRSIWNDDELYTIHADVDIKKAKEEIQGSNTSANFSENYIYAEAIIMAALYAREKFKGSGRPDFYCEPHLVNVMLLARDLNGRRIYDSKADLARALNVGEIHEIEQFTGKTRTTEDGDTKKLLGLFVNLADYQFGSTKGGEVTKFDDFDIDFNKHKYLMETRLSGALTKLYSAIALEEPVEDVAG